MIRERDPKDSINDRSSAFLFYSSPYNWDSDAYSPRIKTKQSIISTSFPRNINKTLSSPPNLIWYSHHFRLHPYLPSSQLEATNLSHRKVFPSKKKKSYTVSRKSKIARSNVFKRLQTTSNNFKRLQTRSFRTGLRSGGIGRALQREGCACTCVYAYAYAWAHVASSTKANGNNGGRVPAGRWPNFSARWDDDKSARGAGSWRRRRRDDIIRHFNFIATAVRWRLLILGWFTPILANSARFRWEGKRRMKWHFLKSLGWNPRLMDEMKLIVNERIFGIFLIEESTNSFVNFFFFIIDQISFCCRSICWVEPYLII